MIKRCGRYFPGAHGPDNSARGRLSIALITLALVTAGCTSSPAKSGPGTPASSSLPSGASAPGATFPATSAPGRPSTPSTTASHGPAGGAVPAGFRPYSVTYVDATHGWVLGTAPCSAEPCTSIARTQDGRTWQGIPAPTAILSENGPAANRVSTLRFADPLNGWAFGDALFSTHDGGATWADPSFGRSSAPSIVDLATSGGYAWAASIHCASSPAPGCSGQGIQLYRTPIGADSWTQIGAVITGSPAGADILVAHAGQVWLSMVNAVYTTDGGPLRRLANPCPTPPNWPTPSGGPNGLAVADANHLDALCVGQGGAGSASKQLVGSTDGGRTWRDAGASRRVETASYGIADNRAGVLLSADASGDSVVSRTTDDGQSFAPVLADTSSGGTAWHDLGFTTSNQAIVILSGRAVYQSTDAGSYWRLLALGP